MQTLLGPIRFNEFHRNVGGIIYTTQVQPGNPVQAQVAFPSSAASANPIFPAPTPEFCVSLLGVPSTLDYAGSFNNTNQKVVCKAWEDNLRLSQNTGGVVQGDNNTQLYVCDTCLGLFNISQCYGTNAVRNVTLNPYFRPSTCGQDSNQAVCEALVGNQTSQLVVPCDYTTWDSAGGIFSAFFLSFCFVCNCVFAALVVRHRNAKAIKYGAFFFLFTCPKKS